MATEFHGFISSYSPAIGASMLKSALWDVGWYDVGENVNGRPLISKLSIVPKITCTLKFSFDFKNEWFDICILCLFDFIFRWMESEIYFSNQHYYLSLEPDQYNIFKRTRQPKTDCFADTQSKVCIVSGFLHCTSPHHQLWTQFLPRMFE